MTLPRRSGLSAPRLATMLEPMHQRAPDQPRPGSAAGAPDLVDTLRAVERRVLWLSTAIIHHANRVRPNSSGVKVGGHQASCASITSIMTALWFASLRADDRVSVKPHAGPVLHAINYLLGDLDADYLTSLRALGGLQSYPSRAKDPDTVDYSTGSVGIGATATTWGALARRYADAHFDTGTGGRQIALLGDAELDEGACWEAIVEPMVAELGEVLWVIDLNRQSLDRIVPGIAADKLARMFDAAGWQVLTLKYGRRLRELFAREHGELLRARIDDMSNAEYQRLLRAEPGELRARLPGGGPAAGPLARLIDDLDDGELRAAVRDLGGHDLADLVAAYEAVDPVRPTVLLAYTIKGRGLPTEGHPANHSTLLGADQMATLALSAGADPADPWRRFDPASPAGALCRITGSRLRRDPVPAVQPPEPPAETGRRHAGAKTTQSALGRLLMDLSRSAPQVAQRVVTASPDVATTTNLAGWINKAGVYSAAERTDWFADDPETLMHWRERPAGQHIELGIAEANLVGLLAELGSTWSRWGQPLLPVGVIYDVFVNRALEPWLYGVYSGGQSILVGTPAGVSLAAEGGAHQSIITPSIGLEAPGVVAYEPAFTQDFEWCFLTALGRLGRPDGRSAYFRLSTRPVDQELAAVPTDPEAREQRRARAIGGGYLLRDPAEPTLSIAAMGAVLPEAIAAAGILAGEGIDARLICVTSADLLFQATSGDTGLLDELFPSDRPTPLVTVLDGHPHTLAFLGQRSTGACRHLGVTRFGQSGALDEVYRHHGIDAESVAAAGRDVSTR